jgi:hypothetical protein
MTNIFNNPEKPERKSFLYQLAVETLEKNGWKVERVIGSGKSSLRRIVKGSIVKTVSIRTSQDTWIAFPRDRADSGWATLAEVDYVIAASVDDRFDPQFAQVHMIDGDEMRQRFDRAYAARKKAGHSLPIGRGMWVSLYEKESENPVNRVGAGAGLAHRFIARVPLDSGKDGRNDGQQIIHSAPPPIESIENPRITIAEAKRLLALSLGVNEADVKITISS